MDGTEGSLPSTSGHHFCYSAECVPGHLQCKDMLLSPGHLLGHQVFVYKVSLQINVGFSAQIASSEVGWMGNARVLAEFGRLSIKMQDLKDQMGQQLGHVTSHLHQKPSKAQIGSLKD